MCYFRIFLDSTLAFIRYCPFTELFQVKWRLAAICILFTERYRVLEYGVFVVYLKRITIDYMCASSLSGLQVDDLKSNIIVYPSGVLEEKRELVTVIFSSRLDWRLFFYITDFLLERKERFNHVL